MTATLKSHGIGATLVLTLSHPPTRNALCAEVCTAAVEACIAADSNPDVRTIILTGEGAHFSSGAEPQQLLAMRHPATPSPAGYLDALQGWIEAMHSCSKPVIVAIEGTCTGAGFALALAADFLVVASDASLGMQQARLGLTPEGGGSWLLLRALPRAAALQLLMCGDAISAQRLQQLGLANLIAAPGQALAQALALAERLNDQAPNVLAGIKELANGAEESSLAIHLRSERDQFQRSLRHDNAGEGLQAALEQRPPRFR
ncbi:MAG: hypothetical protein RJA36_2561 [Pseudomonadota bacterium]